MRRIFSLWSVLLLLLTACGGVAAKGNPTPGTRPTSLTPVHLATALPAGTAAGSVTAAATGTAVPSGSPVPFARPTASAPFAITVTSGDGAVLSAEYYPPVVVTKVAGQKAPG